MTLMVIEWSHNMKTNSSANNESTPKTNQEQSNLSPETPKDLGTAIPAADQSPLKTAGSPPEAAPQTVAPSSANERPSKRKVDLHAAIPAGVTAKKGTVRLEGDFSADLNRMENAIFLRTNLEASPKRMLQKIIAEADMIRDNKPMDDAGLKRALTDTTPEVWYKLLNQKVFFWVTHERLTTLLSARAYKSSNHCVLTIDSAALIEAYAKTIWLCPMNSGCTKPIPHPRSLGTFARIPDYEFAAWKKKRSSGTKAVVEFAVDYAVPDISRFVISAELRNAGTVLHKFK